MIKVGLCGTIGSGKSTVCRLFEDMGIPVYIADDRAKALMTTSVELMARITEAFGSECYTDGVLNRGYLASRIFSDENARLLLNSIVHPAVCSDFTAWASCQLAAYVIVESAILFDSGLDKVVDRTIAVVVPEDVALERAAARDNANIEAIRARMATQRRAAELERLSDYTIYNIDIDTLQLQVENIDRVLREI